MDAGEPGHASVVEPVAEPAVGQVAGQVSEAAPSGMSGAKDVTDGSGGDGPVAVADVGVVQPVGEPPAAVRPAVRPAARPDDALGGTGPADGAGGTPVRPRMEVFADGEGRQFGRGTVTVLTVTALAILAFTLVLRFWTTSDLWLDEALTVDIARQPLHEIPSFLHRDGAPPLFYVLLHFWMGWFGDSDVAVRSLSGVLGAATVPLVWLAGRRLASPTVAWAAALLVATSPFAIRYSTETRMYALVMFLTVLGILALDRSLRRPRAGNLVAIGVVTALLLYSHYWSIYLVGTVMVWLAWQAWRGAPRRRSGARASLAAMAVGCLAFLPWLPTFLYQSRHTGTPWASPANFAAMVNAVASFAGGGTNQGRALALIFFALAGLGVFGAAAGRLHIELDLRTRPRGRPLGFVVVGTLAAAIAGGFISNSTFDARYASVVFVPLILLVSIGLLSFGDRRVRVAVLAVAVLAGLASSLPNIDTNRTQAGRVAAVIAATGRAGDVVAYCPDQLGPAVDRLLPPGRYRQITFPRGSGPEFVNWADYAAASAKGSPVSFAARLESEAAGGHQIFLVWAPGYQTFGTKCEQIVGTLQGDARYHATEPLSGGSFYQPMWLLHLKPITS